MDIRVHIVQTYGQSLYITATGDKMSRLKMDDGLCNMSTETSVKNVFYTQPMMQGIKKQRVDKRDVLE